LPVGGGTRTMSGSNQIVREPRCFSAFAIVARTNGATLAHCRPASSWSCSSAAWVCSCRPATTLDSQDESLTRPCATKPIQGSKSAGLLVTFRISGRGNQPWIAPFAHRGPIQILL
jgi:hypothetical protein